MYGQNIPPGKVLNASPCLHRAHLTTGTASMVGARSIWEGGILQSTSPFLSEEYSFPSVRLHQSASCSSSLSMRAPQLGQYGVLSLHSTKHSEQYGCGAFSIHLPCRTSATSAAGILFSRTSSVQYPQYSPSVIIRAFSSIVSIVLLLLSVSNGPRMSPHLRHSTAHLKLPPCIKPLQLQSASPPHIHGSSTPASVSRLAASWLPSRANLTSSITNSSPLFSHSQCKPRKGFSAIFLSVLPAFHKPRPGLMATTFRIYDISWFQRRQSSQP